MRRTISISGPLARAGAVLGFCLLTACVQRRTDGRRGSDPDSADAATKPVLKRDTGIAAAQHGSANSTAATALTPTLTPTMDSTEQPFVSPSPRADAPVAPPSKPGVPGVPATPSALPVTQSDIMALAQRHPIVPISGISAAKLPDTFNELRGGTRKHEALDILAPRGTPVHSADDGTVIKLFTSKAGGLTVYVTGPAQRFVYYYAHLDSYATGLAEGQTLHKGDVLGYVGTSGNADPNVPHLHFAIARVDNIKQWWKGEPINPTTVLQAAARD